MTKRSKMIVSVLAIGLLVALAAARKHRWEKDDEDGEEAFEIADKAAAQSALGPGGCGVERWAVKTLSDSQAESVNTSAVNASVDTLAGAPQGSPWAKLGAGPQRRTPADLRFISGPYAENQVYRVRGKLLRYKLENDKDYHIVLLDPETGTTLIAESVDASCPGASSSRWSSTFADVRTQFHASFSPATDQFTDGGGTLVTVKGVRFFDPPHGQNGVAQNGVELHPLLCFSTGNACDN